MIFFFTQWRHKCRRTHCANRKVAAHLLLRYRNDLYEAEYYSFTRKINIETLWDATYFCDTHTHSHGCVFVVYCGAPAAYAFTTQRKWVQRIWTSSLVIWMLIFFFFVYDAIRAMQQQQHHTKNSEANDSGTHWIHQYLLWNNKVNMECCDAQHQQNSKKKRRKMS